MTPKLPGPPTFSALMLSVILTAWLGLWGPPSLGWIKDWQSLIGGLATAVGVIVAALNVTRQMRLTARLKEEDRIESDLPGMYEANMFLGRFTWLFEKPVHPKAIIRTLESIGQRGEGAEVLGDVKRLLPLANDQLSRDVAHQLIALRQAIKYFDDSEFFSREARASAGQIEVSEPSLVGEAVEIVSISHEAVIAAAKEYEQARERLLKYHHDLTRKILRARVRLLDLRKARNKLLKLRF